MLCILLQVELAHHYHESVKCRETLAAVSQIERGPALIESSHSFGGEFHCLPCGYSSEVSQHYQRHLKSLKHQRSVAESRGLLTTSNTEPGAMVVQQAAVKVEDQTIKVELEEEPSSTGLYQCLPCEYAGKDPRNYTKHLKTQKHKRIVMGERFQLGEEDRVALARETMKQGDRAPTVTSSGRKVIPKRFIGDEEEPNVKQSRSVKRRKVESGSSPALSSVRGVEKRGEAGAPLRQWTCEFCPILSSSPKELFTHMGRFTDGVCLDQYSSNNS